MKKVPLMLLPASLLAMTAFAQDVRFNYAQGANFSQYKTYKWVAIKDAAKINPLAEQQLKSAIDAQLAAKGLTKTEDDKADLYIAYQAAVNQEKQFNSFSSDMGGWGYGAGWRGYGGMGMSTTTTTSSTIHIGTVGIDMYDSAQKQLVWRGQASKTLDEKAKPEKQQKNLNKAMAKLFKKYPPPVK